MKRLKHLVAALLVLLLAAGAAVAAAPGAVFVLPAVGSINPGLAEFIVEGIRQAERENSAALVIELDTPGGLETSMRQIVQAISNAKVPVIVYVHPRGARAASAGVFVTMGPAPLPLLRSASRRVSSGPNGLARPVSNRGTLAQAVLAGAGAFTPGAPAIRRGPLRRGSGLCSTLCCDAQSVEHRPDPLLGPPGGCRRAGRGREA